MHQKLQEQQRFEGTVGEIDLVLGVKFESAALDFFVGVEAKEAQVIEEFSENLRLLRAKAALAVAQSLGYIWGQHAFKETLRAVEDARVIAVFELEQRG